MTIHLQHVVLLDQPDGSVTGFATVIVEGKERDCTVHLAPHVYQDLAFQIARHETQRSYLRVTERPAKVSA